MSITIEPTVTPAPKPEWPEITAYICRDKYGDKSVMLATVVIPSSAECERKAAALAELERASDEIEECDLTNWRAVIVRFRDARRAVRGLLTPKGTNP